MRTILRELVAAACLVPALACGKSSAPGTAPAPAAAPAATAATPAAASAAPGAFDPTGTYELQMESVRGRFTVTANIRVRADGTLTGIMSSTNAPMLTIRSGTVKGTTLTMRVAADDATEARVEIAVAGEQVTGRWIRDGGDVSRILGRRLR